MSGIYLHIPFCSKKCTYCDFHFSTNIKNQINEMTSKMIAELNFRKNEIKKNDIRSIYFGGGTPSVLRKKDFDLFFEKLNQYKTDALKEVTIEVNPEDISKEKLLLWKTYGINRLSIGVQSLNNEQLKWMNRSHIAEQNIKSIMLAKSLGYQNISIDLIYGLPNMTNKEWSSQLEIIKDWGIQHISAYCLTVEKKTALMHYVKSKKVVMPNEEVQIEQFKILCHKLNEFGFEQYEISNFSKPNYQSLHNSSYWNRESYIGIGPSAHSFSKNKRRWNVANNKKYLDCSFADNDWFEQEELSSTDEWNELILTKLRTNDGVNKAELKKTGELNNEFYSVINNFIKLKWVNEKPNSYVLTMEGRLRADYIASELFK